MNIFKHKTLAIAMAGTLGAIAAVPAQADVMASSVVNITNFVIKGSNGAQLDVSDLSFFTFTTSADTSSDFNGAGFSNSSSSALGPINFAVDAVGPDAGAFLATYGADDSFIKPTLAGIVGSYAAADQTESGSPVTGIAGFAGNAQVGNASYAAVISGVNGDASSNSNNNLNSSFIFSLNQATGITFEFNADAFLQAAVTSDEQFPAFATASSQVEFTITDLTTGLEVFNYSPELFGAGQGNTISLNAPLPIDIELTRTTGGSQAFSTTTGTLAAGTLFQLSARVQTNVDATRVPEPAMISLMGIGLLGMGLGRMRRRQSA